MTVRRLHFTSGCDCNGRCDCTGCGSDGWVGVGVR